MSAQYTSDSLQEFTCRMCVGVSVWVRGGWGGEHMWCMCMCVSVDKNDS